MLDVRDDEAKRLVAAGHAEPVWDVKATAQTPHTAAKRGGEYTAAVRPRRPLRKG